MDTIKSKLIDFEYKLQFDPHDIEVIQMSDQFLKQIRELSNDLDTLLQYASKNSAKSQQDVLMLHTANQTQNKLQYLDNKIVQLNKEAFNFMHTLGFNI